MLGVVCWKWSQPGYRKRFDAAHVNALARMVGRHYPDAHQVICVTDDPAGIDPAVKIVPLWSDFAALKNPSNPAGPSCYRRLRAFSAEAADLFGERFVSLDLDVVVTGDLRPLWNRPEDFVIWGDTAKGTPYNGSMFLLRAGARTKVWDEFDPVRSPAASRRLGYIGSDQGWIGAALGPGEAKWGTADGVYSFRVHLRGGRAALPRDARMVIFHGAVEPWSPVAQRLNPWLKQHYR